jgi:hypothetical protein
MKNSKFQGYPLKSNRSIKSSKSRRSKSGKRKKVKVSTAGTN